MRGMNEGTSLYLDFIRFSAAMVVFLSHISGGRFTGGFLWQFGRFGSEAVDVFFVLSGFVIAYVTDQRERSVHDYMISRAVRIYSVALPALLVTFALDAVGRVAHPDLYAAWWGYSWHGRLEQFLSGVFFLNQLWFNNVAPGSDLPYWSLGYEVWYYAVFGVAVFAPAKWRAAAVLVVLVLIGPKLISLFPIWLVGVLCYYICTRITISRLIGALLYVSASAAWIIYEGWVWLNGNLTTHNAVIYEFTHNRLILDSYIVGGLFAAHLIGFHCISSSLGRILIAWHRPIRWMAGATFTLYLFHLPVAQFLAAETPWPPGSWLTRGLIYFGTLSIVFGIAELTERRKAIWRQGFSILFDWKPVFYALHDLKQAITGIRLSKVRR